MAGMNGYEVCRRIREHEATALVPVVMVTSHDSEARIDGIRAGADDFLTKPFDQQELLLRVRSLVRIKRYHDTICEQKAELTEWNRGLEARVAEQVAEARARARLLARRSGRLRDARPYRLRGPLRLRRRRQRPQPRVASLRRRAAGPDRRQPAGAGGSGGDRRGRIARPPRAEGL